MATTLRPVSHFSDDSQTFRSFPPLPPVGRSSLESSSMKSRKSFLSHIVPARRQAASGKTNPTPGSKLNQASGPVEDMAITNTSDDKVPNRRSGEDQIKTADMQKADDEELKKKKSVDRSRSKSRTILKVIKSTFRSRSPGPPTSPPPASTSLQAQQNREAALRERGLLPPKPVKDLSRQEADQDRQIPVVPREPDSFSAEPSAADLIRRQWEANNTIAEVVATTEDERDRMKSFRFGTSTPPPAGAPDLTRSMHLETMDEVNTPLPSPLLGGDAPPPAVPENHAEQKASSHRSSVSDGQHPLDQTFPSSDASLLTPPATPLKPNAGTDPSSRRSDVDCASTSSGHNRSDSRHSSSSAPPPTNPVISLTPSSHRVQSPSVSSFAASASRRSNSLTQMPSISESSSMMTPSLDASSKSPTTVSTLNTIDSSSDFYRTGSGGRAKVRNGLLTIKTSEHVQTVPMIIESPAEDAAIANPGMAPEFTPLPPSPITPGPSPTLMVPQNPLLTRRGRSLADPGKREKRKLFGFKRGQSAPDESDKKTRRLSVSSSFVSLKRAASNWTRPRSSYDAASMAPSTVSGRAKTFDASHLPPSPTLPSHFMTANRTSVSLQAQSRRALDPTLHTPASIITKVNGITNDEVRRMTEVAFLN